MILNNVNSHPISLFGNSTCVGIWVSYNFENYTNKIRNISIVTGAIVVVLIWLLDLQLPVQS